MHNEASAVKTALWFQFTASATPAPTPTTSALAMGVPVRGETLPRTPWNGSDRSRAIENTIREPDVCTASVHANTATATAASSMRPLTPPSRLVSTPARPPEASVPSVRLGAATRPPRSRSTPPSPETTRARMIVLGVVERGWWVSSESSPAESKPTIT